MNIPFKMNVLPSMSGDTLLSVNIYTDKPSANTLVGNITVAENTAGKNITLADGINHNLTAKAVYQTAGEVNLNSIAMNVDLSAATSKKLVLSAATEDRATIKSEDRVVMLAINTWEVLCEYKHDNATTVNRNWGFGANWTRSGWKLDGAYWVQVNGLQTWSASRVENGGTGRTLSSFNDGFRKIIRISRQSSGELWLSVDDDVNPVANFGVADIGAALVTSDTTLWGFGVNSSNLPESNTLYRLQITHNEVVEANWDLTNGDGTSATVSNGKTIDITTTTGSLAAIWQDV